MRLLASPEPAGTLGAHRGGWRKTEAQLSVYPRGLKAADQRPFTDRQDADTDQPGIKDFEQALGSQVPGNLDE